MTTAPAFSGIITAIVTPFSQGKIDESALKSLVNWQVEEGVQGIVPCGTTGESPTLTHEEHKRVVEIAVEAAAGRIKVIAGAGSNSTAEAVDFTKHAKQAGADAVLQVSPYYNKPTQEGLYQHFKAIAESADIPVILYNIPPRSIVDINNATMARLAKIPNIVGVKEATADLSRPATIRQEVGKDFILLSGEDPTAVAFNAQGGVGCISVTSNVAPKLCAQMQAACLKGDFKSALEVQDKLLPLNRALFMETNPIPVKYAMSLLGKCSDEVRLPLVAPSEPVKQAVKEAMQQIGLL